MKAKSQDLLREHWDDVRIFLAVHRAGSLGKAGLRLGIDTSTVSRRLSALEESLGAPLFERRRDGIGATSVAVAVLPAAEAMEAALGLFARTASGAEAVAEGVVRLSGSPGVMDTYVAPALVRLRARHPGIRIEIDASARVLDLGRHEADIAFRSVRPEGSNLVATRLGSATWKCVGAKALVTKTNTLASWSAVPWITWDHDFAAFAPARWLAKHGPKADVVLRTSHVSSQVAACRAGLGAMLLVTPERHGLVPFDTGAALTTGRRELPRDDLWLVAPAAIRHAPKVAAVWEFFLKELRGLGDEAPR